MPISSSSSGGINTCDCKTVTFTHPLTQSWIILPTTLLQHLLSCEQHDATLHTKAKHNNQAENRITELKHAFHHHTQKHMLFCEHNVTEWRDQKITSRPIPRLFFETKCFQDQYRDFFSRLNIFETDTETFFRDQNFRDRDRYSQKIEKSLDTEKSRDEMLHSEQGKPSRNDKRN